MRRDRAARTAPPPTEAEIRAFCEGRIAHYKVPRYVRFVDDFPTTVTGKVQKFVLRAETAAELGLAEEKTAVCGMEAGRLPRARGGRAGSEIGTNPGS